MKRKLENVHKKHTKEQNARQESNNRLQKYENNKLNTW